MERAVDQPRRIQIDTPDCQTSWEMVKGQLQQEMRRGEYETWVRDLKPLGFSENVYRVGAVNRFGRDWVQSRLHSRIERLLQAILNQQVILRFVVMGGGEEIDLEDAPIAAELSQTVPQVELPSAITTAPPADAPSGASAAPTRTGTTNGKKAGRVKASIITGLEPVGDASPRKIQLQRAYGTERARVIQPERGMFLTRYFFENWLPILGHSAMSTVLAARFLCFWNPMTGELRNVIETDMTELAKRASVSVRTVKDVLNNDLVKRYFLRYRVRRVMTPNGVRTAGIILMVRMDDPLTPEDQSRHSLSEEEHWYTADFEEEGEDA